MAVAARGIFIAWISFAISIILTLAEWYTVKTSAEEEAKQRFNIKVNEIGYNIQKKMLAYKQVLLGGAGLFSASDSVTRYDWWEYISSLKIADSYPGILGLGYSMVLTQNELNHHIDKIRKEGFPNYTVWPPTENKIITSIIYLEPFVGRNLRAFGYDMFSDPIRRKAMMEAVYSGNAVISNKVTLVQETYQDVQPGFLMYFPIYRKGMPIRTISERNSAIKGFIYSPFRIYDLIEGTVTPELTGCHFLIYDGSNPSPSSLLYDSDSAYTSEYIALSKFKSSLIISPEGHPWNIKFSSLPAFENSIDYGRANIILFTGFLISLLLFITARSMAETWLLNIQRKQILESTGEGIIGLDLKESCTFINKSAARMLGVDQAYCLNRNLHEILHHTRYDGSQYPPDECPIIKSIKDGKERRIEREIFRKGDKTFFPVEYSCNPIISNEEIKGVVVNFNDITVRLKADEELRASLKEKDVLLKEIHHRVKNNLQIIASLLNLQLHNLKDPGLIQILKESQNRIRSMALIHEKLYMAKNMSRVNFSSYVQDMVGHLMRSYNSGPVEIKIDIDDINIDLDKTISLGLALNELVTNSLKHAFSLSENDDKYMGEVYIGLKKIDGGKVELLVKDTGKGFSDEINFKKTSSLGLQLVNALVNQIEGNIELEKYPHTKFTITFTP